MTAPFPDLSTALKFIQDDGYDCAKDYWKNRDMLGGEYESVVVSMSESDFRDWLKQQIYEGVRETLGERWQEYYGGGYSNLGDILDENGHYDPTEEFLNGAERFFSDLEKESRETWKTV